MDEIDGPLILKVSFYSQLKNKKEIEITLTADMSMREMLPYIVC